MGSKVVAIVGARLNSSRLPGKQLLSLAGEPLISHVFRRLQRVSNIDEVVLATTADGYNARLVNWAESAGVDCFAYHGDVNDLMGRINAVVRGRDPEVIVYVCGDSPLIEPTTIESLIVKLQQVPTADWARMKELDEGETYIHEGFAVYRRRFWDRMYQASEEAFEKEHVGAVFHTLSKVLPEETAYANEDPIFHSLAHRISVDTPSDYEFMQSLYNRWFAEHKPDTIVDLKWVIRRLQSEPGLRQINQHVHQKRVAENTRKISIVTQADTRSGLGHLKRMVVAAKQIQDHLGASVDIEIVGEAQQLSWLDVMRHQWFANTAVDDVLLGQVEKDVDTVLLDVPSLGEELIKAVKQLRLAGKKIILIDKVFEDDIFDGYFIPCFYVEPQVQEKFGAKLTYGWDCYLLDGVRTEAVYSQDVKKIIILTGGGDFYGLGARWPELLDEILPKNIAITWIQGPYSSDPNVSKVSLNRQFNVLKNPENLMSIISDNQVALSVYGVSFFECLRAKVPTVAFRPKDTDETTALRRENVCMVSGSVRGSILELVNLVADKDLRRSFASVSAALWSADVKPPLIEMLTSIEQSPLE